MGTKLLILGVLKPEISRLPNLEFIYNGDISLHSAKETTEGVEVAWLIAPHILIEKTIEIFTEFEKSCNKTKMRLLVL